MTHLIQGSAEWLSARHGKLTCSNLGALLGQVSYTSRAEAFRRALGTDTFTGNDATRWGNANEDNGVRAYMAKTGHLVSSTGLHTHPLHSWLAGSPDGLVGTDGMIEVKCPYYFKKGLASRIHQSVPGHYWMQVNALLEITGRSWCDYVCWAPEAMAIFRVHRDPETFAFLMRYYTEIHSAIGASSPPPLSVHDKQEIKTRIGRAMMQTVDLNFWLYTVHGSPPRDVDDEDEVRAKRQRVQAPAAAADQPDETSPEDGDLVGVGDATSA